MRAQAQRSSAANRDGSAPRGSRGFFGLVALCVLGFAAFLGSSASTASAQCSNDLLRELNNSTALPDCRAYELVTPANLGGGRPYFDTAMPTHSPPVSIQGGSVIFHMILAGIPGYPATGYNDRYRSVRGSTGWTTQLYMPTGDEVPYTEPGGFSPDHSLALFKSLLRGFDPTDFTTQYGNPQGDAGMLLTPGGYQRISQGSLGTDPIGTGLFFSRDNDHFIFSNERPPLMVGERPQLEPNAPVGPVTIYDRDANGGPTHVVSLLPGNVTPEAGSARFHSASQDGTAVAFQLDLGLASRTYPGLYVRLDNTTTRIVTQEDGDLVGTTHTCTGGPGSATLSYQWLRNGAPIGGATASTYTTVAADAGKVVQCQVLASDAEGASTQVSGPKTVAPYPDTALAQLIPGQSNGVSGTRNVGQLLTCNSGGWRRSPTFAYQWFRNGVSIGGATSSTYTTVLADKGTSIQCRVTATNAGGSVVVFSSNNQFSVIGASPPSADIVVPTASAVPVISNTTDPGNPPSEGQILSCADGTWAGSPTFAYEWLRDGAPIAGETANFLVVSAADAGKTLQCRVTGTTADSVAKAVSKRVVANPQPGTVPPDLTTVGTVTGTAEVGRLLTCNNGTWTGSPTFTYQWLRNGAPIGGATANTYTLVDADRNQSIQCQVTANNAGGNAIATNAGASNGSRYVEPTTGANPVITNTTDPGNAPAAGDVLSCSTGSTWANSPTFSRQWLRDGVAIAGATSSTYTVITPDDDGRTLQCRVRATNSHASVQAVSRQLVADPQPGTTPPVLTTAGTVTGTPRVGNNLTCNTGTWTDPGAVLTRQWLRNGVPIAGATSSPYTLVAADRNQSVQCQVTATNAGGSVVAINASATSGARYVDPNPPAATSTLPFRGFAVGGISEHGEYVFYANAESGGPTRDQPPADLFSYETATGATTQITTVGDAQFANVSQDGSHVYFVSRSQIGGEGTAGQPNFYVWERAGGTTTFIGTLVPGDVTFSGGSTRTPDMVRWTSHVTDSPYSGNRMGPGKNLTRSTPDGSVVVFQSKASLGGANNSGRSAIYRYDANSQTIDCVSCRPGGAASQNESSFQDVILDNGITAGSPLPLSPNAVVYSVSDDGETVFFQSRDQVLAADVNAAQDVYRWKKGEGVALISSGSSSKDSFLYGTSRDGADAVFLTEEHLVPKDENVVGSLYDARVGGGFPPDESFNTEPCSGDACQGAPSGAPDTPGSATSSIVGQGNLTVKRCGSGKRKVVRKGKTLCLKPKKHKKRRHKRANGNRRAAR